MEIDYAKLAAEVVRQQNQAEDPHEPFEADVEVTVCTLWDSRWWYIAPVVMALWKQGLPMHVLSMLDSETIGPNRLLVPSGDFGKYLANHKSHMVASYRYLDEAPHQALEDMIAFSKHLFAQEAQTPYIFFLDQDVKLQSGQIQDMLAEFKESKDIGALGGSYEMKEDHVQMGALLMRTEIARQVGFTGKNRCVCWALAEDLASINLAVRRWRGGMATHLKWMDP